MLLAWILKYVVPEFKPFSLIDIAEKFIEGDPSSTIGRIPVGADLTNADRNLLKKPLYIKGLNNENGTATEGTAVFDILFYARLPSTGEIIEFIINIEAQRTVYTPYRLIRRAVFYACRMISSQLLSIWIVRDAREGEANSIKTYDIREKIRYGHGHVRHRYSEASLAKNLPMRYHFPR